MVNVPGQPDTQRWGLKDFRSNIYYPCRAVADGINPYNTDRYADRYPVEHPFPLYSPLTLLIHQPLLIFPLEWAQWIYFGLTAVGSLLLARLMIQFIPFRFAHVLLLAGFLLASRPGYQNLTVGQMTVTAVLLTLLALRWAETRPWLSGLFLALATFKPTFGCLLFVLMVARRNFKATTCGLVLGCLLTLPVVGYLSYLEGGVAQFVDTIGKSGDHFPSKSRCGSEDLSRTTGCVPSARKI